jgi:hypothetical protein
MWWRKVGIGIDGSDATFAWCKTPKITNGHKIYQIDIKCTKKP